MKIAIISPNPQHLEVVGVAARAMGHQVVATEGGKSRMREVVEREVPELIIVDGMCNDARELMHVEHVTTQYPAMGVILLCASQSPEFLISAMRAGVREILPSPPAPAVLQAAIERIAAKLPGGGRRSGRVLAFMSAKGGSGATFVATNLGWELATRHNVLLIDLNLQFGDALSFVHDARPASTIANVARDIARLDASLLQACTVKVAPQYSVLAAPEDIAQAVDVRPEHVDAILSVAVNHYDFVLLDVPRSLDPVAVRALDAASRIHIVLQSGVSDVRCAKRLLDAFQSLGYPSGTAELILNRHQRSAEIGIEEVQRAVGGRARVQMVPNSYRDVQAAINHGQPLAQAARGNPVARRIAEMASSFNPRQEASKGLISRLFRTA